MLDVSADNSCSCQHTQISNTLGSKLHVIGTGTTSATNTVEFQNSTGTNNGFILDDIGHIGIGAVPQSDIFVHILNNTVDATTANGLLNIQGRMNGLLRVTNTSGTGGVTFAAQMFNTGTNGFGLLAQGGAGGSSIDARMTGAGGTAVEANANGGGAFGVNAFTNTAGGIAGRFQASNGHAIIVPAAQGNVGIGLIAPGAQFHVVGAGATSATSTAQFHNSTGTSNTLVVEDDVTIGMGVLPDPSTFIKINRAFTDQLDAVFGMDINITNTPAGAGSPFLTGILLNVQGLTGTRPNDVITGIELITAANQTFVTTELLGLSIKNTSSASSGVITNSRTLVIKSPSFLGSYTPTHEGITINNQGNASSATSYALQVLAQSGSTDNYGIASAALLNGFGTATPTSTLHADGSIAGAFRSITALTTLDITDFTINCTANTFTVTLPTAVGITGRIYVVKNSGTGLITVDGDGTETIDGQLTQALIQFACISVQSNGANWIITTRI